MINGRFGGTTNRVYFEALLLIEALDVRSKVSFLFDTGADATVLMPLDCARLNVDFGKLKRATVSQGIGGQSVGFKETAILVFADPGVAQYAYEIDLILKPPNAAQVSKLPSLLGRNVTDNWRITYAGMLQQCTAEPLRYDHKFDVG